VPTKRDLIEQLRREELLSIAENHDLEVRDRRVNDDLVDAIVRAKRVKVAEILSGLSRDRLKDLCIALGLDETGREKTLLIDRILGAPSAGDVPEEAGMDSSSLLQHLIGGQLEISRLETAWPTRARLQVDGQSFEVDIYARVVGGSSRGNSLERRFQNPSQQSPIVDDPERYELLFGFWTEQGEARAVIVAFDAYRRMGRTTRFSLFMPLSLLEQAADTGFAAHENSKGETIYAFRPENLGRYVQAQIQSGQWQPQVSVTESLRSPVPIPSAVPAHAIKADSIYIRPQVGMYAAFARLNYKPWFALAEFVDNAIQSFLHHRAVLAAAGHEGPLVIDVTIDEHEISITDRAGGIATADFPRAFSPAAPPDDATGLSEFGLGMKAAACWFARQWSVRTSALGESVERTVSFDIPRISREGVENLPIEVRESRASDHFTVVTMGDLRVRPRGRTLTKIKDHLSSIYRLLIADGVVQIRLTTSGRVEELTYRQPDMLVAPHYRDRTGSSVVWRKPFDVVIDGKRVTGWAGILKNGSHAQAGFSVFRRRRLVEGSVGDTYKPGAIFGSPNSFASLRVVGEMFADGFDVTHTKDGIQWHGDEDAILEEIRRQLDDAEMPLLDQAEGYRVRKTAEELPPSFGEEALDSAANAFRLPDAIARIREEVVPLASAGSAPPDAIHPAPILQQREFRMQVIRDARPWTIRLELVSDPAAPFYSALMRSEDGVDVVSVQLNLDHEFSVAFINNNEVVIPPLMRLLAALGLGERLAREAGVRNPGVVRQNANQILRVLASEEATA